MGLQTLGLILIDLYEGPFGYLGAGASNISPVSVGAEIFSSIDERTGIPNYNLVGAGVTVSGGISAPIEVHGYYTNASKIVSLSLFLTNYYNTLTQYLPIWP